MRAICLGNYGRHLPPDVLLRSGATEKSKFHLTIGREYVIYAMDLKDSARRFFGHPGQDLKVLVIEDNGLPRWKAIELFELVDQRIPEGWEFGKIDTEVRDILALWGYPELIRNPSHFDDLAMGVPTAVAEFLKERDRRDAAPF